jgi:hypothetical protein
MTIERTVRALIEMSGHIKKSLLIASVVAMGLFLSVRLWGMFAGIPYNSFWYATLRWATTFAAASVIIMYFIYAWREMQR